MPAKDYPTVEYLRQCFREEHGRLFWLVRPREHFLDDRGWKVCNTQFSGKEAGHIDKRYNRCRVNIYGRLLFRHSIVWALHNSEWHTGIDHINRNTLDDRISNLRPATRSQNGANANVHYNSTSGIKGVFWYKPTKKWTAKVRVNGKLIHLGYFTDKQEAADAYIEGANKYFGEFATDWARGNNL